MTVQVQRTWRARPLCERCGWIGDWRTSTRSDIAPRERAEAQLRFHVEFWHDDIG